MKSLLAILLMVPALSYGQTASQIAATVPHPNLVTQVVRRPTPSDGPVWAGYLAVVAANVIDVETAQACMRSHLCREANPLVRSRTIGYAVGLSLDTLGFLSARAMHRQGRKLWILPTAMGVGVHGFGIIANERAAAKSRQLQGR